MPIRISKVLPARRMTMRKRSSGYWPSILPELLLILLVAGMSPTASADAATKDAYTYTADELIGGSGFASWHKMLKAEDMEYFDRSHGSGDYAVSGRDEASARYRIKKMNATKKSFMAQTIQIDRSASMEYAESRLQPGGSLRFGPVRSHFKEDDAVHHHGLDAAVMMEIDDARRASKYLSILLLSSTNMASDNYEESEKTRALARFDLEADYDGKARFGVVRGASQENESLVIDEVYQGAFRLTKSLELQQNDSRVATADEWMPCCFGGWGDMNYRDQKGFGKSTKGIFDCTCSKHPLGA